MIKVHIVYYVTDYTTSVLYIYNRKQSIIVSAGIKQFIIVDMCTPEVQCGGHLCNTIAKRACCDCPTAESNYFSKNLGRQCTSKYYSNIILVLIRLKSYS